MRQVALFALLFVLSSCADYSRPPWHNTHLFRSEIIPSSWIPTAYAATIRSSSEYPREAIGSHLISDFIRVYGVPDHFFKRTDPATGQWGVLVYDLTGGYYIAVFIVRPDRPNFDGAQLFAPSGDAVGPVVK
jgi:hypothetical protein